MKRGNDNRTSVQERTSMKDKSVHRNAQHSGRPNPSQNTINPNHGLNEDETTNAYTESSGETRNESSEKDKESGRSGPTKKRNQNQNH